MRAPKSVTITGTEQALECSLRPLTVVLFEQEFRYAEVYTQKTVVIR